MAESKDLRFRVERTIEKMSENLAAKYGITKEQAEGAIRLVRPWLKKHIVAHALGPADAASIQFETEKFPKVQKRLRSFLSPARKRALTKSEQVSRKMGKAIDRGLKATTITNANKAFLAAHEAWDEWGQISDQMPWIRTEIGEEFVYEAKRLDDLQLRLHNLVDDQISKILASQKRTLPKWTRVAVMGAVKSPGDTKRIMKQRHEMDRGEIASGLKSWLRSYLLQSTENPAFFYTTTPPAVIRKIAALKGVNVQLETGNEKLNRLGPQIAQKIASRELGAEKAQQFTERFGFQFRFGPLTTATRKLLRVRGSKPQIRVLEDIGITVRSLYNVEEGLVFGEPGVERLTTGGRVYFRVSVLPHQLITRSGKVLPYATSIGTISTEGKINVWTPAATKPRDYRQAALKVLESVRDKLAKEKAFVESYGEMFGKKNILDKKAPNRFGGSVQVIWSVPNQAWLVTWGDDRQVLRVISHEHEVFDYLSEIGAR